jgi:hypothetical protein
MNRLNGKIAILTRGVRLGAAAGSVGGRRHGWVTIGILGFCAF